MDRSGGKTSQVLSYWSSDVCSLKQESLEYAEQEVAGVWSQYFAAAAAD